jgi:hypothetical protein
LRAERDGGEGCEEEGISHGAHCYVAYYYFPANGDSRWEGPGGGCIDNAAWRMYDGGASWFRPGGSLVAPGVPVLSAVRL